MEQTSARVQTGDFNEVTFRRVKGYPHLAEMAWEEGGGGGLPVTRSPTSA